MTASRSCPLERSAAPMSTFMEREGLSAAGLEAEYAKFTDAGVRYEDGIDRYGDRLRDTHDMLHVLTGYGRDALGSNAFSPLPMRRTATLASALLLMRAVLN